MLSRLVITFLPRNRCLLISWLHSLSAVILEPPKIKSDTVSTVSPSIFHEVMVPSMKLNKFYPSVISEIHFFFSPFWNIGSTYFLPFTDSLSIPTMIFASTMVYTFKILWYNNLKIEIVELIECSLSVLTYVGLTFLLNYFCPWHLKSCSHSSRMWIQTAFSLNLFQY